MNFHTLKGIVLSCNERTNFCKFDVIGEHDHCLLFFKLSDVLERTIITIKICPRMNSVLFLEEESYD